MGQFFTAAHEWKDNTVSLRKLREMGIKIISQQNIMFYDLEYNHRSPFIRSGIYRGENMIIKTVLSNENALREMYLLNKINHPNIVKLYGAFIVGDKYNLVLEQFGDLVLNQIIPHIDEQLFDINKNRIAL